MRQDDLQYLRRRAGDEATNAVKATSPRAAELHSELAEGYAREIARLESAGTGEQRNGTAAEQG